jgi:endo-1,3(4)-beta-glucanase
MDSTQSSPGAAHTPKRGWLGSFLTSHQTLPPSSNAQASKRAWLDSFLGSRQSLSSSSANNSSTVTISPTLPADTIFTSIQKDDILPQVPIGRHHPVPRTGIEDDDMRTLHTNGFYANAFLGKQNQPVWTHPYSLWWGSGWANVGLLQTEGMCVSHVEETDLVFEPGDPAKVGLSFGGERVLSLTCLGLHQPSTQTIPHLDCERT